MLNANENRYKNERGNENETIVIYESGGGRRGDGGIGTLCLQADTKAQQGVGKDGVYNYLRQDRQEVFL